jgi:acetyl esterase/lipase
MKSEQLQLIEAQLRAQPFSTDMSVADMRSAYDAMGGMFPLPEGLRTEQVTANGVPCVRFKALSAAEDRTILYLHGGGYVIGSTTSHGWLCAKLSEAAGITVLGVDYRLSPEHRHPAPIADATAAYRWLLEQGIQPGRIVVAGDSAGGGLTVATLMALRDAGVPTPAAGVCISPWVDLEMTGGSITERAAADPIVFRELLDLLATHYRGDVAANSPLISPMYGDLRGLPPLLIQVGTAETLYDDATRLADRARAAGVTVALETWEDMFHVWHMFAGALPDAQQAIDRIGQFVKERTGSVAGVA